MTPRTSRRAARTAFVGLAAAALGGSLLAAPASAAGETDAAIAWADSQLVDGLVVNQQFDFTDVGLSIDVGLLALAAGEDQVAQRVFDAVVPQIENYVGGGEAGGDGEVYASSVAKAARFVQLAGGDPTDVSGRDLITDLEVLTDDETGRIGDQSEFGDFAAVIGQSFAAAALAAAGSPEAERALSLLLDQQCPGGGFRAGLGGGDAGATCTDDDLANVDSTALAVQLLAGADIAAEARAAAAGWLTEEQSADGSYAELGAENTNSTGLAGYALALEGREAAATRAADYVRGLQVRAPGVCTDPDEGAVAFDRAGFDTQKLEGISESSVDQFLRATAQAGLSLGAASDPTSDLTATGPSRYVRAQTLQPVLVSGLASRDTVCVSNNGFGIDEVAGIDGTSTLRVTTGPGTATRTYTVEDTYGRTSEVSMDVLGRTRLDVTTPDRRRKGAKMRVVATGLAPGEQASLVVSRGDRRTASANDAGRVVFRGVDVARPAGTRTYVVRGEFGRIRKGSDTVRVLRARS
ncbi:hypothetical protein KLP28_01620 [Nocardioidaceae bacterium]|nr:hypothetical protein KLP28_01620 [Nocardioidaceae bacterium]